MWIILLIFKIWRFINFAIVFLLIFFKITHNSLIFCNVLRILYFTTKKAGSGFYTIFFLLKLKKRDETNSKAGGKGSINKDFFYESAKVL